jgi:hypothetical protein
MEKRGENKLFVKNKEGQAIVLSTVLIMLMAIILIVVIWVIVSGLLNKNAETTELKAQLFAEKIDIEDIEMDDYQINITIRKGPGKEVLISETIIKKNSSIVFVVDSTGSMGEEIDDVKNTIESFSTKLSTKNVDFKLGLIEFQDYPIIPCSSGSNFPFKVHNFTILEEYFTKDINLYKTAVGSIVTLGGVDDPESTLTGIKQAINLDYSYIDLKFIIVLTDAPPHARDCEYPGDRIDAYSNSSPTGEKCVSFDPDCTDPVTYHPCYLGPETIEEVKTDLVDNNFKVYYITKLGAGSLCSNRKMVDDLIPATGGKFFDYEETEGIDEILLEISDEIIREYETITSWNYLKVMFYNDTDSYEYKIHDTPRILETKTYSIPDPVDGVIKDYITNVNKIEVYPVAIASNGDEIVGPRLSSWKRPQGVIASIKGWFFNIFK